jgi:hypothetical protein
MKNVSIAGLMEAASSLSAVPITQSGDVIRPLDDLV